MNVCPNKTEVGSWAQSRRMATMVGSEGGDGYKTVQACNYKINNSRDKSTAWGYHKSYCNIFVR